MPAEHPILVVARNFFEDEVRPNAQLIDQDVAALKDALRGMCELGLMAMKRPTEFGGPCLGEDDFRGFQELVARFSGSLSFLQTQHQSAVSLISKGTNANLKQQYLPHMADGQRLLGIGFSQLRRPGPPSLRATETLEGYLLNGHVPWITGYGLFPEYLVAAELPDGRAVFAVVPFTPRTGASFSKPMRLAAMESAQTVTADYESFVVSNSQVVAVQPAGWIKNNDQINIALQRHFALGCCEAALDILRDQVRKKGESSVIEALTELEIELTACRTAVLPSAGEDESAEARLAARAWAIELCTRCAHAAVAASGGQANSVDHPAQRVFRESLVYTVSAQTPAIREATLQRLVHRA